jgi:hypothetical protein
VAALAAIQLATLPALRSRRVIASHALDWARHDEAAKGRLDFSQLKTIHSLTAVIGLAGLMVGVTAGFGTTYTKLVTYRKANP